VNLLRAAQIKKQKSVVSDAMNKGVNLPALLSKLDRFKFREKNIQNK
jgi:hypothetical protein